MSTTNPSLLPGLFSSQSKPLARTGRQMLWPTAWRATAAAVTVLLLCAGGAVRAQNSPVLVYESRGTYTLTFSNRQVRVPATGYTVIGGFTDWQTGGDVTNIAIQSTWPNHLSAYRGSYDLVTVSGQKLCIVNEGDSDELKIQRIAARGDGSQTILATRPDDDIRMSTYFRGRNSRLQFRIGGAETVEFPKVITLTERTLGWIDSYYDPSLGTWIEQPEAMFEKVSTSVYSQTRSFKCNPPFEAANGLRDLRNEISAQGYVFIDPWQFRRLFD